MIERRYILSDQVESTTPLLRLERRSVDGVERDYVIGYAAKFGVNSLDLGDFTERIDPAAFGLVSERRGRRRPLETRALWNHDANYPLARYPRTLGLFVDDMGLRYEYPVSRATYARDLANNIEDGIVLGSSFSFQIAPGGESWSVEDGRSIRTVTRIDTLIDVGPVTFPAYLDADVTVAKRSFDVFQRSRFQNAERAMAAAKKTADLREYLAKHGR